MVGRETYLVELEIVYVLGRFILALKLSFEEKRRKKKTKYRDDKLETKREMLFSHLLPKTNICVTYFFRKDKQLNRHFFLLSRKATCIYSLFWLNKHKRLFLFFLLRSYFFLMCYVCWNRNRKVFENHVSCKYPREDFPFEGIYKKRKKKKK